MKTKFILQIEADSLQELGIAINDMEKNAELTTVRVPLSSVKVEPQPTDETRAFQLAKDYIFKKRGCSPEELRTHLVGFVDGKVAEDFIDAWVKNGKLDYNEETNKIYVPNPKRQPVVVGFENAEPEEELVVE